jgi:hypothetical protein
MYDMFGEVMATVLRGARYMVGMRSGIKSSRKGRRAGMDLRLYREVNMWRDGDGDMRCVGV